MNKNTTIKKLGIRRYNLISSAVRMEGTYDPDEILYLFEESLYIKEAPSVIKFLTWVHKNNKTFGSGNYEEVFLEFLKAS